MKKLPLLIVPILLSGCAHEVPIPDPYSGATIKYTTANSKADVIADWGIPTRTIPVDSLTTAYQWDSNNGDTGTTSGTTKSASFGGYDSVVVGGTYGGGSVSKTSGDSNVDTHACALSIIADNKTGQIKKAALTGTVDDKCHQHFSNALNIDQSSIAAYNSAVTNNEKAVHQRRIGLIVGALAGAGAIAASN